MATNQNIKDAYSFSVPSEVTAGHSHPIQAEARTVDNDQLARYQAALDAAFNFVDDNGDPRAADADDAARFGHKLVADWVMRKDREAARDALPQPADFDAVV